MLRHVLFRSSLLFTFILLMFSPASLAASPVQERADRFLAFANAGYQALYRVNSEAQWAAVTDVTPEHDAAVEATGKAYAAPGFHEGMGGLIALASSQVPYLQSRGVLPHEFNADKTAFLLDDALGRSVPFIYFSCGTMPHWEADIYAHNLPPDQWNARWRKYVSDFQGIEPPTPRGEQFCDAASKTHINDTPAY
jgi:hypothetical protein